MWSPTVAAVSVVLDHTEDLGVVRLALDGLLCAAHLASYHRLDQVPISQHVNFRLLKCWCGVKRQMKPFEHCGSIHSLLVPAKWRRGMGNRQLRAESSRDSRTRLISKAQHPTC